MAKEFSMAIKICQVIGKYSIYILLALVPVFFLPFTSNILDFNKQALMSLLVTISVFAFLIKILISGKFSANLSKTHIAVILLFLVQTASTVFSVDKYGSFWGWPRITADSLFTIIGFTLLYFVIANIFSKKEIFISLMIFSLSALASILYGLLQLLGLFFTFNTIGSVGNLGMFSAILLPILFVFAMVATGKTLKIIFWTGIVVCAIALFLINYPLVWWVVLAGSAIFIIFGIVKKDLLDMRWLALPIFFFTLSLFFVVVPRTILPLAQRPNELYLNQKSTIEIVVKTIKERPVLGSGPGTFVYDFSKYRSKDFNNNSLWNLKIESGSSKFLTNLAQTGILGAVSLLLLLLVVIFYGIRFFLNDSAVKSPAVSKMIVAGIFVSFLGQTISSFLYSSNFTLDLLYFFLIACIVGLVSEKKEYELSPSSFLTLGVTLVFSLIFIFGLGVMILEGQRYVAEVYYYQGVLSFASGNKDAGFSNVERAASLNPGSDFYFANLGQAYLSESLDMMSKENLTDQEKNKIQILVASSINASKISTDLNPSGSSNWASRAGIYQNLIGIVPDAKEWAIKSYEKALELDTVNFYYRLQLGLVYYRDKDYKKAQEEFEKSIALNPNYANGLYFLGLAYSKQGQNSKAIESIKQVLEFNPNNEEVKKVLDNLTNGRDPLAGISEESTPQPPVPEDLPAPEKDKKN